MNRREFFQGFIGAAAALLGAAKLGAQKREPVSVDIDFRGDRFIPIKEVHYFGNTMGDTISEWRIHPHDHTPFFKKGAV